MEGKFLISCIIISKSVVDRGTSVVLADVNFPGEEERGENDGDSTSRMT